MVQSDQDATGRRIDPRVGCVLRLQYRNAGHLLVSYCTNLSRGGLFVATEQPLPKGSRLTLAIEAPGQALPIHLEAFVRWSRPAGSPDGPAGMGVSFDSVDDRLGTWIDDIVGDFSPLRIEIVGDPARAWRHISALLRSLVTCQTRHHPLTMDDLAPLVGADLVIVDVEGHPPQAVAMLQRLAELSPPPPTLALVSERASGLAASVPPGGRVVFTPVDSATMQAAVLDLLGGIRGDLR